MKPQVSLSITATQHELLRKHLLPGDDLEAVAILLCGRRAGASRSRLVAHQLVLVPHADCTRTASTVTWPTHFLEERLPRAMTKGWAIVKMHSHPSGYARFSRTDDESDAALFPSIFGWFDGPAPHASAIMLPDGSIFGRAHFEDGTHAPLSTVVVPGDDIRIWSGFESLALSAIPAHAIRNVQAFGLGTYDKLRQLRAAVIGCSGTGSFVIEELARLGIAGLVLVDSDTIEYKNLNRIVNAKSVDAALRRPKVEVIGQAVAEMGLGTEVEAIHSDVGTRRAVEAVAACDVIFGCVDSVDGRNLLNRIAAAYVQPYFDVGVRLVADGKGGIDEIVGTVHYVRPDGSSLLDRGVFTPSELEADSLRRTDPVEYDRRIKEGYIRGANVDRPAVVSVNGFFASMAVNEFLARLHGFRWTSNADFSTFRMSLAQSLLFAEPDTGPSVAFKELIGRGDMRPVLDMPELSLREKS